MARIRTIKPAFFTSQDVVACSPLARLLFIGLWCEADRSGRLEDKPGQIKMRLLAGDDANVDALLWELHDAKLIRRVECLDGSHAIYISKFSEHQRPHPKEPESLIPDSGRDRSRQNTESREKVVMLPGDFPSSPVGMDKEYGDQEGKGTGTGPRVRAASSAFTSPAEFERLSRSHRYVGARLRVPHVLHREFQTKLGGDDPDGALMAWYADLDAEYELSKAPIPDVFAALRPRFVAWAQQVNANALVAAWVAEGNRGA